MRYWVANTDRRWFEFLAARRPDEVNFWQPNAVRPITLPIGAPWIFKLHVREGGWIVGWASYATWSTMSPRFAWEAFQERNGASSLDDLVQKIGRYSQRAVDADSIQIGASVLVEPVFLPTERWIEPPGDWSSNLTRGKAYDSTAGEGAVLWERLLEAGRLDAAYRLISDQTAPYGDPMLMTPRLGQGAFRVMVTDAYDRRCVITGERTLPVLHAAHIKPYALVQRHEVTNGLLLRSDLHTLFDLGYLTVTPDLRVRISQRIHQQFENGRDYYAMDGRSIRSPRVSTFAPSPEMLEWHGEAVFRP